jgi:hypothetical protein
MFIMMMMMKFTPLMVLTHTHTYICIYRMQNYGSLEQGRHVNKEKYLQEDLDIDVQRMFIESD